MSFTLHVDHAPAYELLVSLYAYCRKNQHKGMDAGTSWVREVRKQLTPTFAERLDDGWSSGSMFHGFDFLVHQCPGERTAQAFLKWVASLSVGELFERLAPYIEVPSNIAAQRDVSVELLTEWDAQYFQGVDPAIFAALAKDAEAKRALLDTQPNMDVIEFATNGVRYEAPEELREVLLVPQFHLRPISTMSRNGASMSVFYGVDALSKSEGAPAPALLRLTKGLGDESRLRMLRFIGGGTRAFAEVVQASGLSLSTVHHHLMILRGAGLITAYGEGNVTYYSLRQDVVSQLGSQLLAYFLEDFQK